MLCYVFFFLFLTFYIISMRAGRLVEWARRLMREGGRIFVC